MDVRETIAGGAAGVAQNLVGFPLDSVKVRMVTSPLRASMGQTVLTGEALESGRWRGLTCGRQCCARTA
jgi:hypothetical protein